MTVNINNDKYERFVTKEEQGKLESAKKEIEKVLDKYDVILCAEEHPYFDSDEDYDYFEPEVVLEMESIEERISKYEDKKQKVRENRGAKEALEEAMKRTPNSNKLTLSDLTTLEVLDEQLLLDNFDNYRTNTSDKHKIYQKRFIKNHKMRAEDNPHALDYSLLIEFDTKSKKFSIPSYDRVNLPKEIYHKKSTVNQVYLVEEIVSFYNKLIEIKAIKAGVEVTYREDWFMVDYDLLKSISQGELSGLIKDICAQVNQFEYSHTKNELQRSNRNGLGVICLYRNNQSDLLVFDKVKYDGNGISIDDYRAFSRIIVERDLNNPNVVGKITKTDDIKVINVKDF